MSNLFNNLRSGESLEDNSSVDDFIFNREGERSNFIGNSKLIPNQRIKFTLGLFAVFFSICFFQLISLQLVHGQLYLDRAEENRIQAITIPARRGLIYDRVGVPLVRNEPIFEVLLNKNFYSASNDRKAAILQKISEVTKLPLEQIVPPNDPSIFPALMLAEVPASQAYVLMSWSDEFPEWQIETGEKRDYVTDTISSLSHILGYVGKLNAEQYKENKGNYRLFDSIGQTGLEAVYEKLLHGQHGTERIEVDARGRKQSVTNVIQPVNGTDIHLTLDSALQANIEQILLEREKAFPHQRVSVVAMNPNDGGILALVSWPSFNSNDFTNGISTENYNALLNDPDRPLFNRSISGSFPSGSTIKIAHAAAALTEKVITPQTSFLSNGGLQVGPWFFPDWKHGGHGQTNVYHAIADSVNTFFYYIGGGYDTFQGLGIDRIIKYDKIFGLSTETGIDLPNESAGFLPSPDWKLSTKGERWYVGDTYNVSIGQGDVLVTPLQIARVTSVFANGGQLITPHLYSEEEGLKSETIMKPEVISVVRDAMRQTVVNGTAKSLQAVRVPVAGKTGTAQWSNGKANHSWFTGFAPFDKPEMVITVLVEEDATGGAAVPIAHKILDFWFDEYNDRGNI